MNSKEKVFGGNFFKEELKILNLNYDQSLERKNIIIVYQIKIN